jgi:DNA invertase Pin-like site-specific DNA recombinase
MNVAAYTRSNSLDTNVFDQTAAGDELVVGIVPYSKRSIAVCGKLPSMRIKPVAGVREGRTALAYLRVSTDEQSAGLEAQRTTIAAEATKRGLELVGEYVDEGVSGTTPPKKRPALSEALGVLSAGDADRLIVAKLDRLARSTIDALTIDACARSQGWALVFGDLDIDTGTSTGQLVLANFAALAQFERDRIAERTREALAVKRAQGVRLGRPSVLPTETVARIISERDAGSSMRAIAEGLTRDEIPTARGGRHWHASAIQAVLRGQQADKLRGEP